MQVALDKGAEVVEFKALLHSFFGSFVRNAAVMLRPDPQVLLLSLSLSLYVSMCLTLTQRDTQDVVLPPSLSA